ncbi:MAG: ATP-binding protein [Myxococcota bacterium]|nr:ATP-binding protein [Myxococcota bacterium]
MKPAGDTSIEALFERAWSGEMDLGPALEDALRVARVAEDPKGAMLACLGLAVIQMRQGEGAACDRWLDLGISLGGYAHDPERWISLLNFRAQRFLSQGLLVEALEPLAAVLQRGDGVRAGQQAQALGNLSSVLALLGDQDAALEYSRRALDLSRGLGEDSPIGQLLPLRAAALLEQDLPGGEALVVETRALLPAQQGHRLRRVGALLERAEAWLALRQGRPVDAVEHARRAHEALEPWGDGEELSSCLEAEARGLMALGAVDEAAEAAARCWEGMDGVAGEALPRRVLRLRAQIARARGDQDTLLEVVEQLTDPGWTQRKGHPTQAVWSLVRRHVAQSAASDSEIAAVNHSLRQAMDAAELARESAQRLAGHRLSFLAQVSHELRTPLQGVLGTVELLGDEPLSPAGLELVEILGDSSRLTLGVVDEVLDLSKLEAGALDLEQQPFALLPALNEVLDGQRARAADFGLQLQLQLSGSTVPVVTGDRKRLQQLLMNLVGNAIKYASSIVVVRVDTQRGALQCSVEDDGPGIPLALQATLFEPYVQAASSRRSGGTGLGLAISRALTKRLGGDISLRSVPGEGACFRFELPFPPGELAVREQGPMEDLSAVEVILAEDNETNRMVLTRQLERMGATVRAFSDGSQVLDQRGDLFLLDMNMVHMHGPETARALRSRGVKAVILALTASVMEHDHQTCLAAGMDGVLTKPLAGERLLALLSGLGSPGARASGEPEVRR